MFKRIRLWTPSAHVLVQIPIRSHRGHKKRERILTLEYSNRRKNHNTTTVSLLIDFFPPRNNFLPHKLLSRHLSSGSAKDAFRDAATQRAWLPNGILIQIDVNSVRGQLNHNFHGNRSPAHHFLAQPCPDFRYHLRTHISDPRYMSFQAFQCVRCNFNFK